MRRRRHLLVAVPQRRAVQDVYLAGLNTLDFLVDFMPSTGELGQSRLGVGFGAERHLPQQIEDRIQARLRADERTLFQRPDPRDRLLDRGRGVVVRLVRIRRVILAQPAVPRFRPVIQIRLRRFGKRALPQPVIEGEQLVVQPFDKLRTGNRARSLLNEHLVEEAQHQRGVVGLQQPPSSALLPQRDQSVVVQLHTSCPLTTPASTTAFPANGENARPTRSALMPS